MGAKGEALARQFEAKAQEAARVLEKLTDADWKKLTEAEKWSVGVTAHHLAGSYERFPDIAMGLASGQSFGNFTRKMLDERNAQHAKDFAGCTRRSAVRNMDRAGVSRHVAMAISGHKTESMYQRYTIVSESDLRAAAEKTQMYLDTLPIERLSTS
jgi:DinB family